ncbi:MAG TPA: hypothetical protein ENI33_07855 [Thermoplasmatales archaeon]|nr:hypothetical protein [Thermoplasmatales archaeon]
MKIEKISNLTKGYKYLPTFILMEKRLWAVLIVVVLISSIFLIYYLEDEQGSVAQNIIINDYDPTVDVEVIFGIDRIRKIDFEKREEPQIVIDIIIDGKGFEVRNWKGLDVYPRWRHIQNVNDSKEKVSIEIKLYEMVGDEKILCDISPEQGDYTGKALELIYSLKDGSWQGEDFLGDESGYGHSSGTEDGNYNENDYEIWFDIYQTDADGDRLTWYEEVFVYGTNPNVSDAGKDYDNDGVPIEWEDKYGYNPFIPENHSSLDGDKDGVQNIEEYMMAEWYADPFRQDIFVEVDFMENRFFGHTTFPQYSKEKVISAFSKHNIMLHIDDGLMGGGGADTD